MTGDDGTASHEEILRRADVLRRTQSDVHLTFERRDASPEAYAAWKRATERNRSAVNAMYSAEFRVQVRRLAAGGRDAVDPALVFLEADPWCFRSGYVKEELLRLLARHQLSPHEQARLEPVLLRAVDAGDRREFSRSCKLAARNKTPHLREELSGRLFSEDPGIARRALLMLTALRRPRLTSAETDRARAVIAEQEDGRATGHWLRQVAQRFRNAG